jgi:mannose-6-phosphate isomerase-like protein (cupin superfamily)
MGMVDHEEIFVLLSGSAAVTLDGAQHHLNEGDALIVPPNTTFGIGNPHDEPVEMVVVLPVGGRVRVPGQDPFVPPWAQ